MVKCKLAAFHFVLADVTFVWRHSVTLCLLKLSVAFFNIVFLCYGFHKWKTKGSGENLIPQAFVQRSATLCFCLFDFYWHHRKTNNTTADSSQSLSSFHNSVDQNYWKASKAPFALLPPECSSNMGTVVCIKVIYCQRELKLFKMIGVISHISFRAGKRPYSAPAN